MPLYNKENCIKESVQSIIDQTFKKFELIIINDGSTDRSLEIVSLLKDNRIRIINQPNEGVSGARNRGAKEAKGKLLFFLDADDYLYPDGLENLICSYNHYPLAQVWTGNYEMNKSGKRNTTLSLAQKGYIKEPYLQIWNKKWNFRMGSFIIEKEAFNKVGGFNKVITIGEDFYFMDMIISQCNISYIPSIIMLYCQENSSLSKKRFPKEKIIEWHLSFDTNNKYQKLIFAELILKRIIIGFITLDMKPSISLTIKHYKKIPLMIESFIKRALTS